MGITYYSIFKNSGGDVGIGTITPSNTKLHIVGDWVSGHSTVKVQTITSFASGGTSGIGLYDSNGTRSSYFYSNNSFTSIGSAVNVPFVIEVNASEKLRILSNGNIGIGTTAPNSTVHVYSSNSRIYIQTTSDSSVLALGQWDGSTNRIESVTRKLFLTSYAGGIGFGISGSENMTLNTNGNLGIGSTSPSSKFVVNNNGGTGSAFYVDVGNRGDVTTLFEHTGSSTPVPFRLRKSGYSGSGSSYGLLYLHMNDGTVGNGSNLYFTLNDNAGNEHEYAGIGANILVNTNGAESGDLLFYTSDAGTIRSEKVRVKFNGNVGIGTSSPTAKLQVEGNIRLNGDYGIGADETGGSAHITYCGGGQFATSAATTTGYLKITLPQSWTSTMMQFYVDVYEYSTGITKTFNFGGYNWTGGPSWLNVSAYLLSDNDTATYTARFGHDGTKCAIYIDDGNGASSDWSYVQVTVRDLHVGFNSYSYTSWANGWDVSFTGTLGTITTTRTVARFLNTNHISGTTNYVSKFTGTNSLGNSSIFDNGSAVGIGTTTFTYSNSNRGDLEIYGSTDAVLALRNGTANSYLQKLGNNFYFNNSGAGSIFIQNNGSDRVVIDSAGFVGISTSTVAQKLHLYNGNLYIQGTQGFNAAVNYTSFSRLIFNNDYSNTTNRGPNKITLYDDGSSWYSGFGVHDDMTGYYSGGHHVWYKTTSQTASNEYMRLSSGGNLGIGANAPSAKLHIIGTTNTDAGLIGGTVHVRDSTASASPATAGMSGVAFSSSPGTDWAIGKWWSGTASRFVIKDAASALGTNVLVIDPNGNVGIGFNSPQRQLEVLSGNNNYVSVGVRGMGVGSWCGIHFGYREDNNNYRKSAIVFERTDLTTTDAQGKIHILNGPQGSSGNATLSDAKLTINEYGNIGIGTTAPLSNLHLYGAAPTILTLGSTSYPSTFLTTLGVDSGARAFLIFGNNGENQVRAGRTTAGGYLDFYTNNTVAQTTLASDGNFVMRMAASGNVGINTTNPLTKLAVNGVTSVGVSSKLSLIGLDINSSVTPTYIKIVTTIPVASPAADFTVNIKGFAYGSTNAVDLSICWHYYLSTFYNATAKSSGGWAPTIRLSAEGGFVAIVLTAGIYWPKIYVESMYTSSYSNQYASGWSWVDADATGSPIVTVPYISHFGDNFIKYGDGTVTIKGSDNNSGKADLSVDSGGTATMALSGQYFRVGNNDVNWAMKMQANGYLATYGQQFDIATVAGTYAMTFSTNNIERMRITGDGNVGIGTTNPVSLLTVGSTTTTTSSMTLQGEYQSSVFNNTNIFGFRHGGTDRWRLTTNQNSAASNDFDFKINSLDSAATNYTTFVTIKGLTGNVGIGTTSPASKLEVKGVDDATITAIFQSTAGGNAAYNGGIQLGNAASSQNSQIYHDSSGDNTLTFKSNYASGTGNKFVFAPGGTERVRFQQNGNVGIGTTNPSQKLEVNGTVLATGFTNNNITISGGDLLFAADSGGDGFQFDYYATKMYIGNNAGSTWHMVIQDNGNVGINQTSPAYKLDVNGSFSATGGSVFGTSYPQLTLNGTTNQHTYLMINRTNYEAGIQFQTSGTTKWWMYMPSGTDASLRFYTNQNSSGDILNITNTGNVGIGTTNPTVKLEVYGVVRISESASGGILQMQAGSSALDFASTFYGGTYRPFTFTNGGSERMRITSAGNVGIGTTTTNYKLNVLTSGQQGFTLITNASTVGGPQIDLYDATRAEETVITSTDGTTVGSYIASYLNHPLLFGAYAASSPTAKMVVATSGNVGIGVINPLAQLHINEVTYGAAALRVDGTSGTLFSVVDDLTDSLMSVNNSAGLPVLEVFADDRVVAGQYGANDFVVRNNKVGIGTSNPDNKLQVHNGVLQVKNIATALARISIDGSSASGDVTQIQFRRNGSDVAYIGTRFSTAPSDGLFFYTPAAGDAMVILSNGNIGINRTAPAFKFDVGGTSGFRDSMAFGPSIGLITWGSFGAGVGFGMRAESTRTLSLGANGSFDHIFISLNGNVGIGTTAPTAFFQINSGSPTAQDAGLQFGDDTGTRMYRATGSEIRVTGGFRSGTQIIAGSYLQTLTNLIYPSTYGVSQRLQVSNIAASAWIDGLTLSPGGMVTVPHIFGHNLYSFRGANRAVNDWDTAGLTIVPTVNSYLDGSWYIDAGTSNDWNRGILSKGKFLRVEGLTLEYESYTQANSGTDVYCMIGFVGGESTSYSYAQTPANLTYQDNGGLSVYTNGSASGSDYSADTRNGWFRFKTVLKGRGAQHYIYRNGIWNLIKETEINDQNDYEWVRVLVSLYRQRIYFRDFKVYVAQNSYRGDTYLSYISGSLGLGTASPTQKLHVVGTGFASVDFRAPVFYDSADTAYYLDLNNTSTSLNTAGGVLGGSYVYATSYLQTGNGNIYPNGTGSAALNINIGNASGNAWVAGLSLALGGNVTVFNNLYANGSLGVGTTSPSNKLTVLTAANVTPVYFEGGSADWSETTPGTGTGTIHLDPGATTDHFGNAITFGASDSSSGTIAQAGIYVRSDGSYGTKMYFATTDSYVAGSKVRMMINESGYVGVGTVAPGRPLTVNGDGTNAAIRILNSAFASSTNTALYTFRGWLPIDLGTTKYYIQVFN